MASPTSTAAVSRADLAGIVSEHVLTGQRFIAPQLLGVIPTIEQKGDFSRLPSEARTQIHTAPRAPRSAYPQVDFEVEGDSFACVEYGLEIHVDDSERALYASRFDLELESAEIVTNALQMGGEKRVADLIAASFALSGSTGATVANAWSDAVNATPIDDVMTGRETVRDQCGVFPDTLVLNPKTITDLSMCDQIVDRVKYISGEVVRGELTPAFFSQIFQVPRILVPYGRYNSADSGQTESLADIWPDSWGFLAVTDGGPSTLSPRVGAIFAWENDGGVMTVEQYRAEATRSDVLRVRQNVDEKIFSTRFGYRLGGLA